MRLGAGAFLNTMKAQYHAAPAVFTPVKIEIVIETKSQLDAFGTMMNYAPICSAYKALSGDDDQLEAIRTACESAGADIHFTAQLGDALLADPALASRIKNLDLRPGSAAIR